MVSYKNHTRVIVARPIILCLNDHLTVPLMNKNAQQTRDILRPYEPTPESQPPKYHPVTWSCIEELPPGPSAKFLTKLGRGLCSCPSSESTEISEEEVAITPANVILNPPWVRTTDGLPQDDEGAIATSSEISMMHPMSEQEYMDQWLHLDLGTEGYNQVPSYSYNPVPPQPPNEAAYDAETPVTLNEDSPVSTVVPSPIHEDLIAFSHPNSGLALPGEGPELQYKHNPGVPQPWMAYSHPTSGLALPGSSVQSQYCPSGSGVTEPLAPYSQPNSELALAGETFQTAYEPSEDQLRDDPALHGLMYAHYATTNSVQERVDPVHPPPADLEIISPRPIRLHNSCLPESLVRPSARCDAPEEVAQLETPQVDAGEDMSYIYDWADLWVWEAGIPLVESFGRLRWLLGADEHTSICGTCYATGMNTFPCACGAANPVMEAAPIAPRALLENAENLGFRNAIV
ncbi:hypothetical protein BKA70DRAFT_1396654 [Coprinopsis sp. MPI-PUGE-AT-0042]|nr:hypothetical protein BKA70DRAFT_1396654 [Coprinopsis sp. MPI-PUGE-AT-0042]